MNKAIEKDAKTLYELGDELFMHPELGYKEFTNKKILTDYFEANGLKVTDLGFRTGQAQGCHQKRHRHPVLYAG